MMRNTLLLLLCFLFCLPVQASFCLVAPPEKLACTNPKTGKETIKQQKHPKRTRDKNLLGAILLAIGLTGALVGVLGWLIVGLSGSFMGLGWWILGGALTGILGFFVLVWLKAI